MSNINKETGSASVAVLLKATKSWTTFSAAAPGGDHLVRSPLWMKVRPFPTGP